MHKPVTIAGIDFPTKQDAIEHCRSILYAGPTGTEVTGCDADFLAVLLAGRPDKVRVIGDRKVVRFWRDVQPGPFQQSNCFYVELDDGERLDFSFYTALDNIVAAQNPPHRSAA